MQPQSHTQRGSFINRALGAPPVTQARKDAASERHHFKLLEHMKTNLTTRTQVQAEHLSTACLPCKSPLSCGVWGFLSPAGAGWCRAPLAPGGTRALPANIKHPLAGGSAVNLMSDTSSQIEPRGHCPIIKKTSEKV